MMMLPQSFGDIYLGETFVLHLDVQLLAVALSNAGLKVEVQTQLRARRSPTRARRSSIARFAPQQTLDRIIAYELRDVIHILICSALYSDAYGEKKYFRKFFKFQVQNPLSMKSKTHALDGLGQLLVETQMHNATCAARNSRAICAILAGAEFSRRVADRPALLPRAPQEPRPLPPVGRLRRRQPAARGRVAQRFWRRRRPARRAGRRGGRRRRAGRGRGGRCAGERAHDGGAAAVGRWPTCGRATCSSTCSG